jgi:hypothetical protein
MNWFRTDARRDNKDLCSVGRTFCDAVDANIGTRACNVLPGSRVLL